MTAERTDLVIVGGGPLAGPLARSFGTERLLACGPGGTPSGWPDGRGYRAGSDATELADVLGPGSAATVVVLAPEPGAPVPADWPDWVERAGQHAEHRLIYWGSAAVYGPPEDLYGRVVDESAALSDRAPSQLVRADEVVQRLLRERDDLNVYLCRAAALRGPHVADTGAALGRLRAAPAGATPAFVQFLDSRDALAVIQRAARGGQPGLYNVSADVIMRVAEMLGALGVAEVRLPEMVRGAAAWAARLRGRVESAADLLRLTDGSVILDNARLKTHFGYRPQHDSREALEASLRAARSRPVGAG